MEKKQDFVIGIFLMVFTLLAFVQTYYFPEVLTWLQEDKDQFSPTPATWPRITLIALFFLSGVLILSSFSKEKPSGGVECQREDAGGEAVNPKMGNAIIFILMLFVYLISMETLGFAAGTILFGFGFAIFLGKGDMDIWKGSLINLAVSVFIFIIFSRYLYLPFPRGRGIFRVFTEFMMF